LLFTNHGLKPAESLVAGQDTLFADLAETKSCVVLHIVRQEHEHPQQYFGLNCLESEVLANGLKASTFERLHTLPAWWMSAFGRFFGIKHASAIGDFLAELAQKFKLV